MPATTATRLLLWVLAAAFVGIGVVCVVVATDADDAPRAAAPAPTAAPSSPTVAPVPASRRARDVLRAWDDARAAAWTTGDLRALRTLYTPTSAAGRRDVAMLRAWNDRGSRLSTLTTQVLRLDVVAESGRRLVLVVTDRVAHAAADEVALPADAASTRRLVLERVDGAWRMASVSPERRARS
ncbi:hypothetical protein ABFT23_17355 [Nocardioides sp. C4-1]|uniref:hypothetical protein n=1 Tax=Nocardioides sp. C4-1 TaxID=3151851 RepID=UPI003264C140